MTWFSDISDTPHYRLRRLIIAYIIFYLIQQNIIFDIHMMSNLLDVKHY